MVKIDTGKFYFGKYTGSRYDLELNCIGYLEKAFHNNKTYLNQAWLAKWSDNGYSIFQSHPEFKEQIELLRMFYFNTMDKPQEIEELPNYDSSYDLSLMSLYTVVLEQREKFIELYEQLEPDYINKELTEVYHSLKICDIPEDFYGLSSINEVRDLISSEIDRYNKLKKQMGNEI